MGSASNGGAGPAASQDGQAIGSGQTTENAETRAALRTSAILKEEFCRIHTEQDWHELDMDERRAVQEQNTMPGGPTIDVEEAVRLATYYKNVHALPRPEQQTALCLSGGGIRSAAFCMGVLQGLARRKLLGQFHYLSTVSGGGYIGSWLAAWSHRHAEHWPDRSFDDFEHMVAERPPLAMAEREPIEWLRAHQRFLNPDSSLASPDTWAPIALLIRDLLLNWLVFVPLILAVLLVPRILEFVLIWWGYTNGGSAFGTLFTQIAHALGADLPAQPLPGPDGWCDVAGALLVLAAVVAATRMRLKGEKSDTDDAKFVGRVLLCMIAGAFLLTMFTAALAIRAPDFDMILLAEWCFGTTATVVLARMVARCFQNEAKKLRRWRSFMLECISLAVSGAATGLIVWALLKLRAQCGMTGRVGVRDLAAFGVPLLLAAYVVGQVVYAGLTSRSSYGREDQEWLARASGFYLIAAVSWAASTSLVLFSQQIAGWSVAIIGAASGAVTLASATSTFSLATSAMKASRAQLSVTKLATLACLIFLASGTVLLSHATARIVDLPNWGGDLESGLDLSIMAMEQQARVAASGESAQDDPTCSMQACIAEKALNRATASRAGRLALLAAGLSIMLAGLSALTSFFVDVNLFSLHALYRNRLVRSFLGASNADAATRNKFDGFSNNDDIPMQELWTDPGEPRPPGTRERHGPFPVVNMALNLAPSIDLARQQRQASSFIATPMHVGGQLVGYRSHEDASSEPLSLGTSMAISGAAFNANWGYHTSPVVRFVMMLFNVRLGWWLLNPNASGERRRGRSSFRLLLQETFGLLTPHGTHVYLSDGGHFDNLGLYEILRRRCGTIVVVDASQDFDMTLEDLGRSLRNAAADMGITIDFGDLGMVKRTDPPAPGTYCAVGRISYPECRGTDHAPGQIVYIKPGFYKDAPADVRAYAASNARFPHDTTINQWFTESQFESYRTLGSHVLIAMFGPARHLAVNDLAAQAEEYMRTAANKG